MFRVIFRTKGLPGFLRSRCDRFFLRRSQRHPQSPTRQSGFTLLELLVVLMIAGVLSAILAPSWNSFWTNYCLSNAQSEVAQAIRGGRETAKRNGLDWQVSFRSADNGEVQWAAHPSTANPNQVQWKSLNSAVKLSSETTLHKTSGSVYRVVFNHKGYVRGQLGKVVLIPRSNSRQLRCVVVSTLLGAMRKGDTTSQCSSS
jgi:prepilin-type N-terminal cleavage/methylation domain-containing protein